jgi:hypothetical protein
LIGDPQAAQRLVSTRPWTKKVCAAGWQVASGRQMLLNEATQRKTMSISRGVAQQQQSPETTSVRRRQTITHRSNRFKHRAAQRGMPLTLSTHHRLKSARPVPISLPSSHHNLRILAQRGWPSQVRSVCMDRMRPNHKQLFWTARERPKVRAQVPTKAGSSSVRRYSGCSLGVPYMRAAEQY